jgi:hypothetical protein
LFGINSGLGLERFADLAAIRNWQDCLAWSDMMSGSGYKIISLRHRPRLRLVDEIWPGSGSGSSAIGEKVAESIAPIKRQAPVASAHQIHAALVAIYKEQPTPPNVNEAYQLVKKRFQAEGKRAPRDPVRKALKDSEFAEKRLPPGSRKKR